MALNPLLDNIPLLLTSSVVAHDTSVNLKDTNERIRLALESVAEWLKIEPTLAIVLCDGSNFNFSELVRREFPTAHIECLYFSNNQKKVAKYGRGYGEGEIVFYALTHSHFIKTKECFAKCTSKLWVKNFKQCTIQWNGEFLCKGVFLNVFSPFKRTKFSYIDTRFYIVSIHFYKLFLKNSHLYIGDKNGIFFSLEDSFFEIFQREKFSGMLFSTPPIICGVGGGTGTYYKNNYIKQLKEKLRYYLVRISNKYNLLFSIVSTK
jgi:hypothetical protein